jgi:hypothetical protein
MIKEFQFYIDDISEDITIEVDNSENTQSEEDLVKKIRNQEWFIEGNKTEGTITFHSDYDISVNWVTITMDKDLSDIIEEYSQDCIINPDISTYKTIEF